MMTINLDGIRNQFSVESMKTTVDIPDDLMVELMEVTGAKTKREAVVGGLREFVRQEKVKRVIAGFGTFPEFATNDEIEGADVAEMDRVIAESAAARST